MWDKLTQQTSPANNIIKLDKRYDDYIVTLDFETYGIEAGFAKTPIPLGLSIKIGQEDAKYYSFGHNGGNNCTFNDVRLLIKELFNNEKYSFLFHNAKFDLRVIEEHFDIPLPHFTRVHDTMLLLFLLDPNAIKVGLKDSCERLLGIAPDELNTLKNFMVDNKKDLGIDVTTNKEKPHYYMKMLYYVSGDVVGNYANEDARLTYELYSSIHDKVVNQMGMQGAYDVERELLYNLITMEQTGVRIDLVKLSNDYVEQVKIKDILEKWIKVRLGSLMINLNSSAQLSDALMAKGMFHLDKIEKTKTGKIKTTKEALNNSLNDKEFLGVYNHYNKLRTCLNTFMVPWVKSAAKHDGVLYTTWNQTKGVVDGKKTGTRTGRLSSTPNFQNAPKKYKPLYYHLCPSTMEEKDKAKYPKCPDEIKDVVKPLPNMRSYVLPRYEGHVLIDMDYSQQEFRIMAHYEQGALYHAYLNDDKLDVHNYTIQLFREKLGINLDRSKAKAIGFGIVYGQGLASIAKSLGISVAEAKELYNNYFKVFPRLHEMREEMKVLAARGEPFTTLSGRKCYCEPPRWVNGEYKTYEYKMINTEFQGGGADATKMAINNFHRNKRDDFCMILSVHDEFLASVPAELFEEGYAWLKEAMESVPLTVKLVADGIKKGGSSWAELK